MIRPILGVVLVGGRSRRMGEDKAAMRFHGSMTQLEYCVALLRPLCERIAVGGRKDQARLLADKSGGSEFIEDAANIAGPMAGIVAALRAAEELPVLALACDMPLIDAGLLLQLVSRRDSRKLATCFRGKDGRPEPLCAIYESACLGELERRAMHGSLSLRGFLQDSNVEKIQAAQPQLLASANTLKEARIFQQELSRDNQ